MAWTCISTSSIPRFKESCLYSMECSGSSNLGDRGAGLRGTEPLVNVFQKSRGRQCGRIGKVGTTLTEISLF